MKINDFYHLALEIQQKVQGYPTEPFNMWLEWFNMVRFTGEPHPWPEWKYSILMWPSKC